MAQVICPKCGSGTELAVGAPYCPSCGWNRDAAIRRLARFTWLLPALIVFFDGIGIFGVGLGMHNWPGAILFATLPTLLLGFVYAGVRQGLMKLRAPAVQTTANSSDAASFTTAADASASREKSEQYNFLLALPPPRPVRLSRRGKTLLTVILLFAFGMEAFVIWSFYGIWQRASISPGSRGPEIVLVCFAALVAGLPFFVRRGMVRDKNLMESGAVTMGRVTAQRNFKNTSTITYEFQDAAGHSVTASGNDITRSFFPGMSVPVFYDVQNAKRNVAVCASFFEIANPSGE